ncbi:MAG: glycosyltransferase family 2 protein, partial [Lachnospiraceae bacterium]
MTVNHSFTPAAGCLAGPAGRRLYTVIPAYEPDEKLIQLVKQLHIRPLPEEFSELWILIVDDGSSSACSPVFDRLRKEFDDCRILVHPVNRGKGAALKTAFAYLLDIAEPDDVVVLMDADGQHKIEDAMRVALRCAEDRGTAGASGDSGHWGVSAVSGGNVFSLYTGSRHFSGRIPLKSRLGNKITRKVFKLVSGIGMEDTQTGLRAFQAGLLEQLIRIPGDRYEYEMNMLMQLGRDRVPIIEVPIETIYEKSNPTSHFNPLKDSLKIYREIV